MHRVYLGLYCDRNPLNAEGARSKVFTIPLRGHEDNKCNFKHLGDSNLISSMSTVYGTPFLLTVKGHQQWAFLARTVQKYVKVH